jgi:hypothetical protein
MDIGSGLLGPDVCSLLTSGTLGTSGAAVRLEKADMPNKDNGLSLEPARARVVGGGGKTGFDEGSGEDL